MRARKYEGLLGVSSVILVSSWGTCADSKKEILQVDKLANLQVVDPLQPLAQRRSQGKCYCNVVATSQEGRVV
jgi:hypothetical protein